MASLTENYGLKKPAQTDLYNIDDFNNNADIIDSEIYRNSQILSTEYPTRSVTLSNVQSNYSTVYRRRENVELMLDATLSALTAYTEYTLFSALSSAFRPNQKIMNYIVLSTGIAVLVSVGTDGIITLATSNNAVTSGTRLRTFITYTCTND
jgi:hypothetical protein